MFSTLRRIGMTLAQAKKLGYSFKTRNTIIFVTYETCFQTGDSHWDGDIGYDCYDSEYGEYATLDEALEDIRKGES